MNLVFSVDLISCVCVDTNKDGIIERDEFAVLLQGEGPDSDEIDHVFNQMVEMSDANGDGKVRQSHLVSWG